MTILSQKIKTYTLTIAGLLLCAIAGAQPKLFRYKADVAKVDSSGVYKIELQPKFTAKSVINDLTDIRLMDERGKYVAYSIFNDSLGKDAPVFVSFPEIKGITTDTSTVYISDAGNHNIISELWFKIKNTDVSRFANLSGSDDLKHWFAIKEGIELQGGGSGSYTEYEQVVSFPANNYRYFRMQVDNKNKNPIKITQSGIYISGDKKQQIKQISLPPAKFTIKNGKQETTYFAELDDKYIVDAIRVNVTAPKYYERMANVSDANKDLSVVYTSILSSSHQWPIHVSAKTDKLRIEIINMDDNPLTIKEMVPMQLGRSAVAYLEKGRQYYLLIGDSTAREVSYDLTFLHSKPMSEFPTISHSAVYINPVFGVNINIGPHRNFTLLLWSAIIGVLLLLSLLTWRMVKEINARPRE